MQITRNNLDTRYYSFYGHICLIIYIIAFKQKNRWNNSICFFVMLLHMVIQELIYKTHRIEGYPFAVLNLTMLQQDLDVPLP